MIKKALIHYVAYKVRLPVHQHFKKWPIFMYINFVYELINKTHSQPLINKKISLFAM